MAEISAERVKELREKSGAGFMDCKRALAETNGDLEKAIDFLRKEGTVKAAKKTGRVTSEGLIGMGVSADRRSASLVEVNCETDFVARTDQFQEFLASVAETILQNRPKTLDDLLKQKFANGTLESTLTEMIARIGENMGVRRFHVTALASEGALGAYIHAGSKIGVVIGLQGKGATEEMARDIAMHVAAMSPAYIGRKDVPQSAIDREKEIARQTPEMANKPANIIDKILDGKINRYFSEVCLTEQPFIKDPTGKKTVGQYLQEKAPGAVIVEMVRYQVGEAEAAGTSES